MTFKATTRGLKKVTKKLKIRHEIEYDGNNNKYTSIMSIHIIINQISILGYRF